MRMATGVLLVVAALPFAATPAHAAPALRVAAVGVMHGQPGHGPPDVTKLYICRVLPRYGGGFCTSPPYAPLGRHCTCEGPHGPRPGVVEHR
jgi:hypothetical protein